ncbi:hypothetical protein [Streptomyces violaceoruber]|uniref:hypothetical protein n=1 Tax=Streptomyces violaceoruber TaxID=1935 RepID=UPI00133132D4|nr:hypothetical protein [Streptomyces violaceoruber]
MSEARVLESPNPSLVHRLAQPVPAHLMREYLASRPAHTPVPETFRGPNWKQD